MSDLSELESSRESNHSSRSSPATSNPGSPMFKRQRRCGYSDSEESGSDDEDPITGIQGQAGTAVSSATFPDVGVTAGAHNLWKDQVLFDYTIEVEDKQFKVHKVIMATVSEYFKVMLTGGMNESQTDGVRLEGLTSLAVSNMIEFVYTGQFGTTKASPEELLACAVYFQIPAAIAVCTDLVSDKVNKQNCFDIMSLFKTYSLKHGIAAITEYISHNREAILKGTKPEELSRDNFLILVDCWRKSEWDLFLSAQQWIEVDNQNRQQHLNALMSCVRFALMTPKQLESIKEMDIYSESDGAWRELIDKALTYHAFSSHQKVVYDSHQNTVRAEPKLVVFSSDEYTDCLFYTLPMCRYTNKARWEEQELKDTFFESGIDAAIGINNFLIVSDVNKETQKWHIFDPRTITWALMGSMVEPRSDATLVYSEKHLYALGGHLLTKKGTESIRTDSIEKYDFEADTWTVIPSTLPATSGNLGAGVIDGKIYVVPHKSSFWKEMEVRLDCYNPVTHTWSAKAPLVEPKNSLYGMIQVLELWNEEVLFIMRQGFNIQYYSPTTDQWSTFNLLPYVDTNLVSTPYMGGKVLAHGNLLFFFNLPYQQEDYSKPKKKSGCAKWTVRHRGQRIIEDRLDDFEVLEDEYYKNEKQYFPALLAMV